MSQAKTEQPKNLTAIKWLTFLMFMMFAMTTDSVGIIIPEIIRTFKLSLTAAGAFQYATMGGIAIAGFLLGHLADRFGRKTTIVAGLMLFAASSFLFIAGESFLYFCVLMALSGVAIAVFKTGALALVGDISKSTAEHTSIMNTAEGFFGIGSIFGPLILAQLLSGGTSWKWLYVLAGGLCVLLILTAIRVQYPTRIVAQTEAAEKGHATAAMKNPYVLAFSAGAFLYVAVECAIYVWMPTLLAGYTGTGDWIVPYSISIFFGLRAAGRFLGAWMLDRFQWNSVLALFSGFILVCFALSTLLGGVWAVVLLPFSGLFMSVIYPTLNSKGISCLPKSEHGAGAGVLLFFTCLSAVLAPMAIGAVGDAMGSAKYGFMLATVFAALQFVGLLLNGIFDPTARVFVERDKTEYDAAAAKGSR